MFVILTAIYKILTHNGKSLLYGFDKSDTYLLMNKKLSDIDLFIEKF